MRSFHIIMASFFNALLLHFLSLAQNEHPKCSSSSKGCLSCQSLQIFQSLAGHFTGSLFLIMKDSPLPPQHSTSVLPGHSGPSSVPWTTCKCNLYLLGHLEYKKGGERRKNLQVALGLPFPLSYECVHWVWQRGKEQGLQVIAIPLIQNFLHQTWD